MAIPSVMQGLIETEDGKVFELDSPKGAAWLDTIGSFRYEPTGDGKPYTVRKEASAYWYGCRKVAGKVRKKYIGKSSDVSIAKLEEIAEALETPPEPRTKQVAQEVAQVVQVVEQVAESRVTVLELQVVELLKAVKDLQEALPGKSDAGNSEELPEVDNEVVERLQNELSNLTDENEKLRGDYVALLESSTHVTNKLREEVREVRSQLETERADCKLIKEECDERLDSNYKLQEELSDRDKEIAELRSEPGKAILREEVAQLRLQLSAAHADRDDLKIQLADLKQKSATARELPDAADLLNQLKKAKGKKSSASLADIEAILEMIEES